MAGTKEMNHHSAPENLISPEKHALTIPFITISGPSGTGKTETGRRLSEALGIPSDNFIKTGDLFRKEMERRGLQVMGFVKREIDFDESLDRRQANIMREATVDNPFILEGRLAGVINKELQINGEKLNGVSLLFICDQDERERRLINRERNKGKTSEQIIQENFERDTEDFGQWQKIHPILEGKTTDELSKELYGASAADEDGNRHNELYDFVVDTTHRSIAEVADFMIEQFALKGYTRLK